jgi:hypothetical protein
MPDEAMEGLMAGARLIRHWGKLGVNRLSADFRLGI